MVLEDLLINDININYCDKFIKKDYKFNGLSVMKEDSYQELIDLATMTDSFKKIMNLAESLASIYGDGIEFRKKLNDAHNIYSYRQKILAEICANSGDFEDCEKYLRNANISVGGQISLESRLKEEEFSEIFNMAVKNTSFDYFFNQAKKFSFEGDLDKTKKYCSLSMQKLKLNGVIGNHSEIISARKRLNYEKATKEMSKLISMAYNKKIKDVVHSAIYHTISDSDIFVIKRKRNDVIDLVIERANLGSSFHFDYDPFLEYIKNVVHPVFDELEFARDNPNHFLRSMYETDGYGKVSKVETGTQLVPMSFYSNMVH